MNNKKIYPVIHLDNNQLALDQADIAFECGADGVFVISHNGDDEAALRVAHKIKEKYKDKDVGVNLLSTKPINAMRNSEGLDMIWFDFVDIIHGDITSDVPGILQHMSKHNKYHKQVFAGIAFKYQEEDTNYRSSTIVASNHGFVVTTSGHATGQAPDLNKIINMSKLADNLAIASGMTPDNIEEFAPYLTHILVATGVSIDAYHFDYEKLRTFIGKVRNIK